jgi:hypothetical protein
MFSKSFAQVVFSVFSTLFLLSVANFLGWIIFSYLSWVGLIGFVVFNYAAFYVGAVKKRRQLEELLGSFFGSSVGAFYKKVPPILGTPLLLCWFFLIFLVVYGPFYLVLSKPQET